MSEAEYSERLQALEDEIASLRDTNAVLMESVEASLDSSGGALAMLQRSILLEKLIEERTRDTELSNRLLRQEVSDRVKAERRFLLFKSAVEHAAEGMVITDTEGVIEYANPAFLAITGYGLNEVMGAPLSAFRSVNYSDDFYEGIWSTLRRGDVWKGNLQSRRADGSLLDEEDTMSPVRDSNGAVINFVILVRDVTKEKSLEAQLRQAQKLESIGQLAAGIAHEINTPTQYVSDNTRFLKNSIGDLVELIERYQILAQSVQGESCCCDAMRAANDYAEKIDLPYLVEEIPKSIDQCLEGLGRVAGIVKAMKEFSHPGTSGLVPTDLNKAISSTITVCRSVWKYVAELQTDFDSELPSVPCLPADFNQVILNIIVNAADAIADRAGKDPTEKGRIRIATQLGQGCAEILIQDNGAGMPDSVRQRIFDPFFTTKEIGKGTGQGLAIAHHVIVDKHGGSIACESTPEVGTSFIIRLPLCNEQVGISEDESSVC